MSKIFRIFLALALFAAAHFASAHAVVTPKEAQAGSYTVFTLSVPSEKDSATTEVRLVLPPGLAHVTPNVKSGWTITVEKNPEGAPQAIRWTGGSIPAGQRDEFAFSTQVPKEPLTLNWKAYQTYKDGTLVSWDLDPKLPAPVDASGKTDHSRSGPYSMTSVVVKEAVSLPKASVDNSMQDTVVIISIITLLIALFVILAPGRGASRDIAAGSASGRAGYLLTFAAGALLVFVIMHGHFLFGGKHAAQNVPQEKAYTLMVKDRKLASGPAELSAKEGDTVTIAITVDETEEFHLHGYDKIIELEKDKEGTMTFVANMSGRFPFELEHSKTELGALNVMPK